MADKLILITGGARSGKSRIAETLITRLMENSNPGNTENKAAYLATGETVDPEFKKRIKKHQESRPAHFTTYEENLRISDISNNQGPPLNRFFMSIN